MDLYNLVSIFYLLYSIYPERVEGCSFACDSGRCPIHRSGALQLVNTTTSRSVGHVIYHILCAHPKYYVGSTKDFKVRWSNHKPGCRNGRWANCGLTKHFGQHHRDEMEVTIADLKVTYFDHLTGNYREERLLQLETDWIVRMETFGPTGLNTRNQLLSQQRRNWSPGH